MKDLIFTFEDLGSDKATKKVTAAFSKAGESVVSSTPSAKVQRTAGVTYRTLDLTFADGQTIALLVKQTGDIYQVKLNGSVVPVKNQDDQKKAVAELVKLMESNRPKFQAKLAKTKAELPAGTKSAAPKMEETLKARIAELDTQIAERRDTVQKLRDELGTALDGVSVGTPAVGDWIECLTDVGDVSNSPWTHEVTEIKDGKYRAYNDNFYEIPDSAFTKSYVRDSKKFFVVEDVNALDSAEGMAHEATETPEQEATEEANGEDDDFYEDENQGSLFDECGPDGKTMDGCKDKEAMDKCASKPAMDGADECAGCGMPSGECECEPIGNGPYKRTWAMA